MVATLGAWPDIVNVPHHPEGLSEHQEFDVGDVRLMLLLTVVLTSCVTG